MTRPAACSKGHSCEICLSNYVPKHFSMAFIATASKGIRCCCCRCFVCKNKQVLQCKSANSTEARFLQRPTQSIQREQHMGLRRHKASHIHKWLTPIQKLNRKVRVDILDEHYSFRVFFLKAVLCFARDLSERALKDTVMIHESNTKHCFFWAWSPRSRRLTANICSKCITWTDGA